MPGCRIYLDPLQDLDRVTKVVHGLLDRLSNPRAPLPCDQGAEHGAVRERPATR